MQTVIYDLEVYVNIFLVNETAVTVCEGAREPSSGDRKVDSCKTH